MILRLIADLIAESDDSAKMTAQPEKEDIPLLLYVAKKHSLSVITAAALNLHGLDHPDIRELCAKAMRISVLTDREHSIVCNALRQKQISFLPLKGITLKAMYPKYWMREMSDVDILLEPESYETVKDIMIERGYTVALFGKNNEDVYHKPPFFSYEMHRTLFDQERFPQIQAYFEKKTYQSLPDDPYRWQMDVNDTYIYLLAHLMMHYSAGGTGLRSLLDIRLYLQRFEKEMDRSYLDSEFQKLGATDFEKKTERLAKNFLQPDTLSEQDREELDYYIFSGTYGTKRQYIRNRITRKVGDARHYKLTYIKQRIIVPNNQLREHPFYLKHPKLRFVLATTRLTKAVVKKPKALLDELNELNKAKRPPRS